MTLLGSEDAGIQSRGRQLLVAALSLEGLVLVAAIVARLLVSQLGSNYDWESETIVAGIVGDGGNVYAETARYNYGPVFMGVLGALHFLSGSDQLDRLLVVGFLTLVDLGIWAVLRSQFGRVAAAVFLLNPISIIITGYHNQFDNLAVLLGLLAVVVLRDSASGRTSSSRFLAGLGLLGLSLCTKHVFFVFPLWIAVRQVTWGRRLAALAVPPLLFVVSFLPFLPHGGKDGILRNVVHYSSANNSPLMHLILPDGWVSAGLAKAVFLLVLVAGAFVFRSRSDLDRLLLYTVVLVVFAPAMANQYLAIPMAAAVAWLNAGFVLYVTLSTLFLGAHPNGFGRLAVRDLLPSQMVSNGSLREWDWLIAALTLGLVMMVLNWLAEERGRRLPRWATSLSWPAGSRGASRASPDVEG